MRTTLALGLALTVITVGAAPLAEAAPAATPKTVICGQIKHGPHATYVFQINHKKLSGNTWTVFATGVPCPAAMKAAPKILKLWAAAKVDANLATVNGFLCTKENDGNGSSGSAGCHYKGLANIELMMTGPYTIAQLKHLFYIK
jgi:hypothetical protein